MNSYLLKIKNKYNALPLPVKASFFFVFCGAFKDAVDVIATPIFTRILTTEEYGLYNVYNSWYVILRLIITFNIFGESFNVGLAKFNEKSNRYSSSQLGLITALFIPWTIVFIVFHEYTSDFMKLSNGLIILMFLQILFSSSYLIWFQQKKYAYSYLSVTIVTVIYTVLQPILGIVLIKFNHFGANNGELRIFAAVGVFVAFGLFFYVIQFVKDRTLFDKSLWKFSIKLNAPLLPHNLSQILLNHSDKLMINAFVGESFTAIYSVSHSAAFMVQAITTNLNAAFIPWFYEKLKKKDYEGIKKVTTGVILLSATVVALLVLVAPEAIRILAPKEYDDGVWVIPPLAFSVFLILIYTLFSDLELFYEKSRYILVSSIVGAGSNILLNYIFIPKFGIIAAGYTTVAGYVLMCIGHYLFTKITCKNESIPFNSLFNTKHLMLITFVLAVACAFIMLLYNHMIIRYLLFVTGVIILLIKKDFVISTLGIFKNTKNI